MKITRRTFVKGLCAAVALSAGGVNALELVNTGKVVYGDIGRAVTVNIGSLSEPGLIENLVEEILIKNARAVVGENVVIEIRMSVPFDYGEVFKVSWHTNEEISRMGVIDGVIDAGDAKWIFGRGVYYCGSTLT